MYVEQSKPKIDAEIGNKGLSWTETNRISLSNLQYQQGRR